jgi:hypothetical protein
MGGGVRANLTAPAMPNAQARHAPCVEPAGFVAAFYETMRSWIAASLKPGQTILTSMTRRKSGFMVSWQCPLRYLMRTFETITTGHPRGQPSEFRRFPASPVLHREDRQPAGDATRRIGASGMSGTQGTQVHNARITFPATAFSNLALAVVVAGFIAPATSGQFARRLAGRNNGCLDRLPPCATYQRTIRSREAPAMTLDQA